MLKFKQAVVKYQHDSIASVTKWLLEREKDPKAEKKVPNFAYSSSTADEIFSTDFVVAAAALVFMTLILYSLTFFIFSRYDVR